MTYAQLLHHRGRLASLRESVIDTLDIRFGEIPEGLREAINGLADDTKLRSLHRAAIQCASIEAFSESL